MASRRLTTGLPGIRQPGRHHLLQKLHFRELYGDVRQCRSRSKQRLFYQLPHRLAFSLAQIAPASALAAGHVFLGFTKCGQFLLSYTHSCDTDDHTLQMVHRYRLHWWVFVPYAPLRKVAEVFLFGDQDLQESIYDNIFISVCQWPRDLSKILVYGSSLAEGSDCNTSQTRRVYITITAVPSLDNCSACCQVATSYEDEDLAEHWNSCVRFSCLAHGVTVHTSYEMVAPFPKFLPHIQMKREGYVVLNAGNFIHVLHVNLENMNRKMKEVESEMISGFRINQVADHRVVGQSDETDETDQSEDEMETTTVQECRGTETTDNRRINYQQEDERGKKTFPSSAVRAEVEFDMLIRSTNNNNNKQIPSGSGGKGVCVSSGEESPYNSEYSCTNNPVKITLNSTSASSSSTMTDRDREWELLISSGPSRSNSGSKKSEEMNKNDVGCSSSTSFSVASPTKDSVSAMFVDQQPPCDSDICDSVSVSSRDEDQGCSAITGLVSTKNMKFKEFQLPDDSPYHFYGDEYTFIDNDSDDSTLCSQFSEDSRSSRFDHREQTSTSDNRRRSDPCTPTTPKHDDTSSPRGHTKPIKGSMLLRSSSESSYSPNKSPSKQAEKEYDFIDEIPDSRHEKLSTFRRRRLADKKYEFSDENVENVPQKYVSLNSFRNQTRRCLLSPSRSPRLRSMAVPLSEISVDLGESSGLLRSVYEKLLSPNSGYGSPNDVLRPINQNITSPILSPRDDRWKEEFDKLERAELQRWSSRESLGMLALSPSYSKSQEKSPATSSKLTQASSCIVDFNRRYIEVDDELVSIITDIDDDELSTTTGYHNALPLEVHGTGYAQMHMISNTKAEKLNAPGLLVRQVSLDVEQFCHEMGQSLCTEAGKKYFFCCDYNVEIIDVCPSSGNVIALASVLVQAGAKVKGKSVRTSLTSLGRRQYKTTATFVFNMDTKDYYLLDKGQLQEEDPYSLESHSEHGCVSEDGWWQSAHKSARQMRMQWAVPTDYYTTVKVLTNEPLLKGKSLNHIMEGQHLVALVLGPQLHQGL